MAVHFKLLNFLVIFGGYALMICSLQIVNGQTTDVVSATTKTTDDPKKCAQEFLDWCKEKDFSNSGYGMSVSGFQENGGFYTLACITNSFNGTECKKNNDAWFQCKPDKSFTFKGEKLSEDTEDKDVCEAKKQYFGMIQGQKLGQEAFRRGMEDLANSMEEMRKRMSRMFSDGFPFRGLFNNDYNRYNVEGKNSNKDTDFDDEP